MPGSIEQTTYSYIVHGLPTIVHPYSRWTSLQNYSLTEFSIKFQTDESILVRSHILKLDTDLLVIVSNQRWHTLRLVNGQFMNESRLSAISGVNKLLKQVYKPKMIFSIDNENQLLIRAQLDPNNGRNLELSSCGLVPILQSTTKTIQLKWRFLGSVPINQNNKILMVILPVLYDKQLVRRIAIIDNQYVYTLPYVPMENYSKSHYQKYKVNKITIDDFLHCSWQLLDEYQSNQLAIILVLAYLLFLTILFI
ncbi:hypothetical protein BLOT_009671 [Blomia tropicalis]|nr:hypothetical protein BLOT_009671 [Blomia tropicalis]